MDVDLMDCTEFFIIVVLTVLVNFFHLNFTLLFLLLLSINGK